MQVTLKRKMFPEVKGRAVFVLSPSWFSNGKMAIRRVCIRNDEVLSTLEKLNRHAVVHEYTDERFQETIDRAIGTRGKKREFRPTPWLREIDIGLCGTEKLVLFRVWESEDGKRVLVMDAYTDQLNGVELFRTGTQGALYTVGEQFVIMPAVGGDDKPPFLETP